MLSTASDIGAMSNDLLLKMNFCSLPLTPTHTLLIHIVHFTTKKSLFLLLLLSMRIDKLSIYLSSRFIIDTGTGCNVHMYSAVNNEIAIIIALHFFQMNWSWRILLPSPNARHVFIRLRSRPSERNISHLSIRLQNYWHRHWVMLFYGITPRHVVVSLFRELTMSSDLWNQNTCLNRVTVYKEREKEMIHIECKYLEKWKKNA